MPNENLLNTKNICVEFYHRFKRPWCFSFSWHFIAYILVIGGAGIILSLVNHYWIKLSSWPIIDNIITYSLALAIPSTTAILQSFNETNKKVSLIEVTNTLFIVLPLVLAIITYLSKSKLWAITCASLCLALAWIAWVLANYDNDKLNDKSFDKNLRENVNNYEQNWG